MRPNLYANRGLLHCSVLVHALHAPACVPPLLLPNLGTEASNIINLACT
jgi:hypothetical protein